MNPLIYKVIHLLGVMGVFTALGAVISSQKTKGYAALHGISLALIFVSGFGMIAKLYQNNYTAPWVIVKIVVLIMMGAVLAMAKRRVFPPIASVLLILMLGAIAAWFGVMKTAGF